MANALNLFREGDVGFIDWLDGFIGGAFVSGPFPESSLELLPVVMSSETVSVPVFESFPYYTYIAGIFNRDVDAATAVLVFADTNQKIGTVLIDANGNRVPFKPQAMLDESLKQQKRIAELEATVERQQKGMEVLTAQLKGQVAQIQKVSAQLEMSRSAPQTMVNNQ